MWLQKKIWVAALLVLILIVIGIQHWPPSVLVILAGPTGGYFEKTALLLKKELKEKYNIDVLIKQREDTLNIIKDVNDPRSGVSVGFVAQDIKANAYPNVTSLGSIVMQPLFIFARADSNIGSLSELRGKRIALSPPNSGTRVIAEDVLNAYGINSLNSTFLPLNLVGSYDALVKNEADIGFFLLAAKTPLVSRMADNPDLRLLGLADAQAVAARLGYPSALTLNRGMLGLYPATPPEPIGAVGLPVTIVANKSINSAHAVAIATVLKESFHDSDLVTPRGIFPSLSILGHLPANRFAADIYQREMGYVPFLYQHLPFRIAGLIEQTLALLGLTLTVFFIYNYSGLPKPYELWQRARARRYLEQFERLQQKATFEQLSEKDYKKIAKLVQELETSIMFSGVAFNRFQKLKDAFDSLLHKGR
ncbi:MAG: ABC transporter substrate-binding protein [Candidatus Methylopumilus sp.]|nr:ABC transporter substrate-binding protein [Candidatus Methylopumilus sp.]